MVGVSWGTILSLHVVQQYPEKFYAYIAYAQLVNMNEGELMAYHWMSDTLGKEKSVKTLTEIGSPPFKNEKDYETFSNILMNDSEAGIKKINGKKGANALHLMSGVLFSPDYTLKDIWNTLVSANDLNMKQSSLTEEMHNIDFYSAIQIIEVPIYFAHGKHDMIIPTELTYKFYEQLESPYKEFRILSQSAHIPNDGDFQLMFDYIIDVVYKEYK